MHGVASFIFAMFPVNCLTYAISLTPYEHHGASTKIKSIVIFIILNIIIIISFTIIISIIISIAITSIIL